MLLDCMGHPETVPANTRDYPQHCTQHRTPNTVPPKIVPKAFVLWRPAVTCLAVSSPRLSPCVQSLGAWSSGGKSDIGRPKIRPCRRRPKHQGRLFFFGRDSSCSIRIEYTPCGSISGKGTDFSQERQNIVVIRAVGYRLEKESPRWQVLETTFDSSILTQASIVGGRGSSFIGPCKAGWGRIRWEARMCHSIPSFGDQQ